MAVPYAQALAQAEALKAAGQLPPNETIATIAQKIMRGGAEEPALPERGGMPAMTTGLLEGVRAAADPIAAETAARQARAAQAGGVSPEMEAIYAAREARLAKQDEDAPKDDRRAAWDALAQMGFKMAQTTSPYFATALAEGMQAGSQGYNAAKIAAAEKAARREEEKENVSLARLKDRQAAIAANEAAYGADVDRAGKRADLTKSAADAAKAEVEARYADRLATVGLEAAEQGLKNDAQEFNLKAAQIEEIKVRTKLAPAVAAAQMERDRRGNRSDDAMTENQRRQFQDSVRGRLNDAKKAMFDAKRAYELSGDPLDMTVWRDATQEYKDADREFKSMASGRGGSPASTAAKSYDFTYVPGKGVLPAR